MGKFQDELKVENNEGLNVEKDKRSKKPRLGKIVALALVAGIGIPTAVKLAGQNNSSSSQTLQNDLAKEGIGEAIDDEIGFNGTDYTFTVPCKQDKNLIKVLFDSKLDGIIEKYDGDIEKIMLEIPDKGQELAELNRDLIIASIADSLGVDFKDVNIDLTLVNDSPEQRNRIANGEEQYNGHTLRVSVENEYDCEAYMNNKTNYDQIPEGIADLITGIQANEEAPNLKGCPELDGDSTQLERGINDYEKLSEILGEDYRFTIHNKRLCLGKDGKYYDCEKAGLLNFGETFKFSELSEPEKEESSNVK